MIEVTDEGTVLYKTEHNRMARFPEAASQDLLAGLRRNFQVSDPLDFLAELTQHIPNPPEQAGHTYSRSNRSTSFWRAARQSRTVPSSLAEARRLSSDENTTAFTSSM